MSVKRVIADLKACLDDGEWERAGIYLADLHTDELIPQKSSARIAGAIVATLRGVEHAVEHHNATAGRASLDHLAYLVDGGPST